jgi:hypothetical protein
MLPVGAQARWRGLLLEVDDRKAPARLRPEAAGGGRLRIVAGEAAVLWARIAARYEDVQWFRADAPIEVVPPIRAEEGRRRAQLRPTEWWKSWTHWFAAALEEAPLSPLVNGYWTLRPAFMDPTESADIAADCVGNDPDLLVDHPHGEIDLFSLRGGVLPLRRLPPATDGRAKAYRKVSDGLALAPVLVWWVGPLACHVVLDGHARLAAALHAGVVPKLLSLSAIRDPAEVNRSRTGEETTEARRDRIYASGGEGMRHAAVAERMVADAQLRREQQVITPGWLMPGGAAAWDAEVDVRAPGWRSDRA